MTVEIVGIIGILLLLALIALRIPIAYSMLLVGFLGFSYLVSPQAALNMVTTELFSNFSSYTLSVIPMFVWMGFIAYYSGVGTGLYTLIYRLIGYRPGGLAIATQGACAIFGAICGSNTATAATMGAIALPEMRKYKYNDSLSTASVAAAGALGILILRASYLLFTVRRRNNQLENCLFQVLFRVFCSWFYIFLQYLSL